MFAGLKHTTNPSGGRPGLGVGDTGTRSGYRPGLGVGDTGTRSGHRPGLGVSDTGTRSGYRPGLGVGDTGTRSGYRPGLGVGDTGARSGHRPWPVVALSMLFSAAAVSAAGGVCALIYPILTELRADRRGGAEWTEDRMLGFWSLLVLSVSAGCICCVSSWTLTYLDSDQAAMAFGSRAHLRDGSDHGFLMGSGVAVLNGIMAMLTVIWSLT